MREFQLTRYLQRWWWVIAVVSALSGILFFFFISSRQTYRAQIMLEFTNDQAAEGLYPSGDPIDVQEIRSSSVIFNALDSIGRGDSVDSVRSRVSITPNVSEQDAAIQTAKWTSGESYDFFPTQYILTYTTARGETSTDARRMVEAVADSYIRLYSEKYVSVSKVPNSIESLQNLNYDYIEWAEIIDNFIRSERDYLTRMKNSRTTFRSSATGYSFQDLYNEYNLVYNVYLPSLYSLILDNHVTNNRDLLLSRYHYRMDRNDLAVQNYQEALVRVEEMIESYTEKNRDTMSYHWSEGGSKSDEASGNNYVLGQVYDFESRDNYSPEETTYDAVLNRYVQLRSDIELCCTDNDYCRYVLSAFENTTATGTAAETEEVADLIALIEGKLTDLDALLTATAAEHSEVETIRNVRVRSTANVKEVTNVKLYTVMIVAVFFAFGVVGAVIVGRSLDFVEYRFYTDPSTDLPNRLRCDSEIAQYARKKLALPFACVVINLTNLNEINGAIGRDAGNEVLRIFAGFISDCAENYGFVGYNGSLQFLGLFPSCDDTRAGNYRSLLSRTVEEFNRGGHGAVIRYKIAAVVADEAHPYTMRELISAAMAQLKLTPETVPGEPAQAAEGAEQQP